MSKEKIDISCFSEPWHILNKSKSWYSSGSKRATIVCHGVEILRKCKLVVSSVDWVAATFGDMFVLSCYLSLNENIARYSRALEEIKSFIRH